MENEHLTESHTHSDKNSQQTRNGGEYLQLDKDQLQTTTANCPNGKKLGAFPFQKLGKDILLPTSFQCFTENVSAISQDKKKRGTDWGGVKLSQMILTSMKKIQRNRQQHKTATGNKKLLYQGWQI